MTLPDWLRLETTPRYPLPDGSSLRLLSAQEVLEARREALTLAEGDRERALCSNACLLARALVKRGKPVYPSGQAVLDRLTVAQIQDLARQWADFDRRENPGLATEKGRVDALKKAWSTCRSSAFAGVCSARFRRCPPKNE